MLTQGSHGRLIHRSELLQIDGGVARSGAGMMRTDPGLSGADGLHGRQLASEAPT